MNGCDPYDDPERACYWGWGTDENGKSLAPDDSWDEEDDDDDQG